MGLLDWEIGPDFQVGLERLELHAYGTDSKLVKSASLTRGLARTATPNRNTCLQAVGQATLRQMRGLLSSYCL